MGKRIWKRTAQLLPSLLGWALVSVIFWSWVFNLLTETDRAHKVTLFANMHALEDRALAISLEEELPDGIRMVQVHSFDYALMDSVSLETADLYIMTEAQAREHADWLCPLPAGLPAGSGELVLNGEAVGFCLRPEGKPGIAAAFLHYDEAGEEAWYLCFGRGGFHLRDLENGVDHAALSVALRLLEME